MSTQTTIMGDYGSDNTSMGPLLIASGLLLTTLYYHFATTSNTKKQLPGDVLRPPHVISWIPFLGSAIDMGTGVVKFIQSKGEAVKSPLFSATILGEQCLFIADPELLYTIMNKPKYTKYLDAVAFHRRFLFSVLGMTPKEVEEAMDPAAYKVAQRQFQQLVTKKEALDRSTSMAQEYFVANLPRLVTTTPKNGKQQQQWQSHDMFAMVGDAIFKASMGPFLRMDMATDESHNAFKEFNRGIALMYNNVPQFITPKACEGRAYLTGKMTADNFDENASPLMKARNAHLPISISGINKVNLGLVFAAVGNTIPATYWTLLHLLAGDRKGFEACRAQVDELVTARRKNDSDNDKAILFTLEELDEMTLLSSALWEALRMYQALFAARIATEDFVVECNQHKYAIEKGIRLMPFWGSYHRDPHIFENPNEYQYDRFVGERDYCFKSGTKINYFPVIAFGGGEHRCPGQKFAFYEAKMFIAMMMVHFDMRLAAGQSIPAVDPAMEGIGVSHPAKEVKIELCKRA